jgi:hypothetical protein
VSARARCAIEAEELLAQDSYCYDGVAVEPQCPADRVLKDLKRT